MANTLKPGQSIKVSTPETYKVNDIAVFDVFASSYSGTGEDDKQWQKWVFRIAAISGQKIEIKMGEVWLDDKPVPLPDSAKLTYEIVSKEALENLPLNELESQVFQRLDSIVYYVPLTKKMANDIRSAGNNKVVVRLLQNSNNEYQNFGPFLIPRPGDIVDVNSSNYYLYQNIPAIMIGRNEIAETLYFFLGDNRDGAQDSRIVGLISHSKLKGIVK